MINIVFALICRIQTASPFLLLLTITTPFLFIICVKKKSKKPIPPNSQRQPPSSIEPTSPSGNPAAPNAPPTSSGATTTSANKMAWKGRQRPIVVFDDEVSKSNAKTPKSKSVEEHSEKIVRSSKPQSTIVAANTSNSQKFDSSASVHERDTVVRDTVVAPPAAPRAPKEDESFEDQQSEETGNVD